MQFRTLTSALALAACVALPAFAAPAVAAPRSASRPADTAAAAPTVAEADAFVAAAEKEFTDAATFEQQVQWINATNITDDTDAVAAAVGAQATERQVRLAKQAARFDGVQGLSYDTARKLAKLKQSITLPAPSTPGAAKTLNELSTRMSSLYGKGRGTLAGKEINGSDIEAAMGDNRNPAQLKEMWTSWHDNVGAPMKQDYARLVEIANQGAKELGYKDLGAMWRAGYDMPADDFAKLTDRLWQQMRPLYEELHCYTRARLNEKYGDAVQPKTGPIRADLLGNMWAQEWGNIYDIVAPKGAGGIGYDVTALLLAKKYDPVKMVKTGEGFYSSLGFAPLPETFWQRSQITKPRDREVICHASAWDVDAKDDIRIKMCTKVNGDDFVTIHHELGHNYYQRAYNQQSFLYRDGANDGFHEAIGDFVALSITPDYLVKIGLLDAAKVPGADKDIGLLLRQAMDKVAFLPFGLLIDKWRWGVFDGTIKPDLYNKAWTDLRLQYQGIVPPAERPETAFDPGAKYHVPATTPYMRYFLARILQFQFYKAACDQAGWTGPLHRCSFYDNKAVGEKLDAMLKMGASKPWPDALETFTGTREMDGAAMLAYFAPLADWLKEQNKGRQCGW
ncbi:M2 family metallopeptidase [Sphingomonas profundi]|uniref:M2 family metallopeptidase n=1 Tax=Alterirhizorhabdus profundi TaxID=2681549 RepID=UPI0018D17660|nr:M2 family metallopeptidase [Sphingomonas profundi]